MCDYIEDPTDLDWEVAGPLNIICLLLSGARPAAAMPLAYLSSFNDLALSLPTYHHPQLDKLPLDHADDHAASDDPESSPSALSSYSPYPGSYDHRPSPGSISSESPPTTADRDVPLHPRVAVEDDPFAFAVQIGRAHV